MLHFVLSELKELNILGADLVLALQFCGIGTLLDMCRGVGLIDIPVNRRGLLLLLVGLLLLLPLLDPLRVVDGLRVHDLELLLKTRFRYFLLLQFALQRSDVIKRHHAATVHILLAGLPEMVVILLPEHFFLLGLLEFLPGFFEVVDEEAALVDEDVDDLAELPGVSLAQIGEERL